MKTRFLEITPVMPSADIQRDAKWDLLYYPVMRCMPYFGETNCLFICNGMKILRRIHSWVVQSLRYLYKISM
jgi:hypothetical protein